MRWLFDLAWVALVAFVAASSSMLPDLVFTHHRGAALPRASYETLMLATAIVLPWLCTRGLTLLARRYPLLLHLPSKEYWLAPERRATSIEWLGRHSFSFGLLVVGRLAVLQWVSLEHNLPAWPQLVRGPLTLEGLAQGLFLVGMLGWAIALRRRFGRPV